LRGATSLRGALEGVGRLQKLKYHILTILALFYQLDMYFGFCLMYHAFCIRGRHVTVCILSLHEFYSWREVPVLVGNVIHYVPVLLPNHHL
jgi:hypothetical protein